MNKQQDDVLNLWHQGKEYDLYSTHIQKRNAKILYECWQDRSSPITALEFGCGTGHLTNYLANDPRIGHLVAFDVSGAMVTEAEKKINKPHVKFINRDFRKYPPDEDCPFEVFFSNAAFHWLYPDYKTVLNKVHALLSKHGRAFISTAGKTKAATEFDHLIESCTPREYKRIPYYYQPFSHRRLSIHEFSKLALESSFSIDDVFLVERNQTCSIDNYINWLVVSGASWNPSLSDKNDFREILATNLKKVLKAEDILMGHWTTMAALTKQG